MTVTRKAAKAIRYAITAPKEANMRTKLTIALIMLLAILATISCTPPTWRLLDQGSLTSLEAFNGCPTITFDEERVVLLNPGYSFQTPPIITLGKHYLLYKENATSFWNGYHLVEEPHD